jgi:hypothetical protein
MNGFKGAFIPVRMLKKSFSILCTCSGPTPHRSTTFFPFCILTRPLFNQLEGKRDSSSILAEASDESFACLPPKKKLKRTGGGSRDTKDTGGAGHSQPLNHFTKNYLHAFSYCDLFLFCKRALLFRTEGLPLYSCNDYFPIVNAQPCMLLVHNVYKKIDDM